MKKVTTNVVAYIYKQKTFSEGGGLNTHMSIMEGLLIMFLAYSNNKI